MKTIDWILLWMISVAAVVTIIKSNLNVRPVSFGGELLADAEYRLFEIRCEFENAITAERYK